VKPRKESDETRTFEEALSREGAAEHYTLRLYVAGTTPRSMKAIRNIRAICEEKLQGRYELEVIDIYQQPVTLKKEQIVVAPTLVKSLPLPVRKLIGDLSNKDRVLVGLDLVPREPPAET
jgi:circadian clock protein KaiB